MAHGYAALRFGDKTALYAGRLTLNPLKHLDWFGSIILPALLSLAGMIPFGWAKPVPYNPGNLTPRRKGILWVAMAGILTNLVIVFVFGVLLNVIDNNGLLDGPMEFFLGLTVILNLVLAIFNMIPLPPLDGSKVLFELLPYRYNHIQAFLERYAMFILIAFIFFGFKYLTPLIGLLFTLITGVVPFF